MRVIPLLLLSLLLVPMAQAGTEQVQGVFIDHFVAPTAEDFTYTTGCAGGGWAQADDGSWFEYVEQDLGTNGTVTDVTGSKPGAFDTGCGTAALTVPVPAGNEHLHVRFWADRDIERTDATFPINIIQEVRLMAPGGDLIVAVPYLSPEHEAVKDTFFDLDPLQVPAGIDEVVVAWYFEDRGATLSQNVPDILSGVAFSSRVHDVVLEFSAVPVDGDLRASDHREGTLIQTVIEARLDVAADAGPTALRVRVDKGLAFSYVVLPDGTRDDLVGTVDQAVLPGYDLDRIQIEEFPEFLQVTLTAAYLADHGPGEYRVVFTDLDSVVLSPVLIPLAALLFALPLPFAVLAFLGARTFERVAFGAYRRTARNLRLGVVAILLYYLVVVVSAAVSGRLDLALVWPVPGEGWLLYVQVIVAIGAFVALWQVARQMVAILGPRSEPDG